MHVFIECYAYLGDRELLLNMPFILSLSVPFDSFSPASEFMDKSEPAFDPTPAA